ncbi:ribonucleoside-diphosphate reductase alpha chain [Natronocella acetinitrilica]|uniref:Ribonucleoside-diphosphate reductase n=1 Tax=Natronocella acetinitrilica TaxID=414046 RepID=A0AAE3G546_9GAMM|nr:LAGLIDADG family homing endonuclease [Natronocella acetinitrilica]MCP1674578.1 ribonucleoside-diphosphate reductase alpha chain [Natronocella acetinitrilica]
MAQEQRSEQATTEVTQIGFQAASVDIWEKKYRLSTKSGEAVDATIEETYRRVARALADIEAEDVREHWYERFLWAMRNGAIPAGRIISNAGAQAYKPATSTINCTVSGTLHDSMDGILQAVHKAGLTLKSGCGIGYEHSTLRPKGGFVSGAGAYTSGPLSFMDIFDRMCFTVSSAGGRRGAQMGTFDVGHPDVFDFIRAKRENGRLRQFNLSLLITDAFMEAVKADTDWPLSFPVTAREVEEDGIDLNDPSQVLYREWPTTEDYITNADGEVACRIHKVVKARRVWDMIMASTYDYAEPGFLLIDRYNELNNNWFCENIRASNPCVTADTWVHTDQGPAQVADLIGEGFRARVDGTDYATGPEGFFHTGEKAVLELLTSTGQRLRLTPDHRVLCLAENGERVWAAAQDLKPGDQVVLHDHRDNAKWRGRGSYEAGYLLGMLKGDGTLNERLGAILSVWQGAAKVANGGSVESGVMAHIEACAARALTLHGSHGGFMTVAGRGESRFHSRDLARIAAEFGMTRENGKSVSAGIERSSSRFHAGFLRGLFDADGSVQGSQQKDVSVRLSQSDLDTLEAVQRMLLRLGITSTIYRDRRVASLTVLPDGKGGAREYPTAAQHELIISGEDLVVFGQRVGFIDAAKAARLDDAIRAYRRAPNKSRFAARVIEVRPAGVADVYDVQVPGPNAFDANGIYAHNCGEQGLPPNGSCLLGSVNLTLFVREPFTDRAHFDWETYREVVRVFSRMLDNVVEINGLPLPEQRDEITRKRRHGMGYLGLGSTLAMLRMTYGSEASVGFTEEATRELAVAGWEAALELAREKGPAPIMTETFTITQGMLKKRPELAADGYKVGDQVPGRILHAKYSRYMQKIASVAPELVEALAEVGARYTHHSSIAPTGTISLSLANNASNGIEPSFAHHYFRNVIREGRKAKEKVDVYSFESLAYKALVNPSVDPNAPRGSDNGLPAYFTTSDEVTPTQHVDIQAAAQAWIDSSISKTANVPTDFPFEDFKDIYLYAYESGLKGCTTFRFNPEVFQGVLVKEDDLKNTRYSFTLEDGSTVSVRGDEEVEYDGETHTAANLYDALKEGYYGKF